MALLIGAPPTLLTRQGLYILYATQAIQKLIFQVFFNSFRQTCAKKLVKFEVHYISSLSHDQQNGWYLLPKKKVDVS